ncbi:TrbI/VirB10 family protein [Opitutus terrae]|uniref:TrbI/VirB10 family protein n=1 Tax=Opitutus terrae (strain DSM 11246 / JCM 15787 / PB90-1) TaxID=452637 RepID=B1ZPH4_OPITP|nr:TrbI/VirB10 family protein [Opitutus terrae]ACB74493.1 hypothetical protein Oter_1207 [Opitutus terrae PB90-1]
MNPRTLRNFLTSKFGLFVVFVIVLFTGLALYGRHQAAERQAARLAAQSTKKIEIGRMRAPLSEGLEDGVPQEARPPGAAATAANGGIVPFRPVPPPTTVARERAAPPAPPPEKPRKIRYPSLLTAYEPSPSPPPREAPPPERFIPFGTLLKCKLVNTVDSANLATPVIAVLLEDVWQNGERVIPANTLVHGSAQAGRLRDRITAAGTWRFVWQDGRELAFTGVALDREYDHDIDGYGITDGSAGLKGRLMAADDLQELKMLAAAALSGFARGTQDRTQTALGSTITGSVSNGVREGVGEVFELYAHRTLKDIEQNGYFVRVPAGKEFYVYVVETVDPQQAKVAGVKLKTSASAPEPVSAETKG